jgi:hypothetical protein
MTLDTNWCEKAIQLLIKARGSSWGNTGSTPHFESGESPVSHESSKIPIPMWRYWELPPNTAQPIEALSAAHMGTQANIRGTRGDNFSPGMPCQWYVRGSGEGKRRILIGQSVPPTPFGMAFGRLKLSPLYPDSMYPSLWLKYAKVILIRGYCHSK